MVEVEMKFPINDFAPLEERLAKQGAQSTGSRQDTDHYFNAPDRDFATTDEAFRLRRMGPVNVVTYKGPKRDAHTKTRTEIEVNLAEGDETAEAWIRIVTHLGYRPSGVVRKDRRRYHLEQGGFSLEITLDDVEEVGHFAELEIVTDEEGLEAARTVILQTADSLGLKTSERRSYLELLLASRSGKSS